MDTEDLRKFGELLQAVRERRELAVPELYEAGWLLGEMTRYTAALADHMRAQVEELPGRYILRADDDRAPEDHTEDARYHLAAMASELGQAGTREPVPQRDRTHRGPGEPRRRMKNRSHHLRVEATQ
ncbi:hypothetical protein Aple_081360 [Acrocarpospora pleiomorpha]|uniref:Uncharacterized protein n=1 Tax=Acrocarpospora pleiomorpha TaxID=90975 RepID=A0A5M3XVM4_9ACTN|nr:hypothetical protein [Acrocarpospora pleiomorpha]GES25237.1 hypothetical protein Aple_081360 [Acrocarpospora pleiomorpha]